MPDTAQFLSDIQSDNADARFVAWRSAANQDPGAIADLGKRAAGDKPGVAKAAREALTTIVHAVGKDPAAAQRAAVVREMLALAGPGSALPVRVHALRLLSLIAGEDAVPAIAKWIGEPDVREEVVFCVERIPGTAAVKALVAAYPGATAEFKPRILAALGHRRAVEGVPLCVTAMRSPDTDLAMAAFKAFGRIGRKPAAAFRYPLTTNLTAWQKIDHIDSQLRYADAQAAQGNQAEAMKVYTLALEQPEQHLQCAAIIGIAKIGTAEAAAAIFPKLKSRDRAVRITAQQAWAAMAKAASQG